MDCKVLIVDDETAIVDSLKPFLSRAGFNVATACDGVDALERLSQFDPDIIILDVVMPRLDGRQLLRELRNREIWTPVILLTAVGDATERAMALTEGADDYLNKPYDPHELVARIRSVLRRADRSAVPVARADLVSAGALMFDRKSRTISRNSVRINLTPRAMHLLEFMMLNSGDVLSRERILEEIWGWNFATGTRSVDARIVEIRKALHDDTDPVEYIETVPGHGYRFVVPVETSQK